MSTQAERHVLHRYKDVAIWSKLAKHQLLKQQIEMQIAWCITPVNGTMTHQKKQKLETWGRVQLEPYTASLSGRQFRCL